MTNMEEHLGNWYGETIPVDDCSNLVRAQVNQTYGAYFVNNGIAIDDFKSFYFKIERGFYPGDCDDIAIIGVRDETDKEFAARVNAYNKRLVAYEKWYKDNHQKIQKELTRRKEEESRQKQASKEHKIKTLEAKLKRLKKS